MTLKDDKEGIIPLSKEFEEQLGIWYNNINLKINLAKEIEKKDKEIDKLNNIINELEKYISNLDDNKDSYGDYEIHWEVKQEFLDKLKELKGEDKE